MGTKQRPFDSCKAVSSVVGLLLMYSLAIIAVGIILVYNVPVLNDMQDSAKAQKVEQAFTVLDSRISKTALGESPSQTTTVSLMGGSINVNGPGEDQKGVMTIQLINHTNNMTHEFNASLGTVEYVRDDRKVAYEGGGVWSDYGSKGGVVMVSPPEFHYNRVTLTLPIMAINGNSSSTGEGNTAITVKSTNEPYLLYPNKSANRSNPVTDYDELIVYIKSDYYKGWANYANSMGATSATLDEANKTAIVYFKTEPEMGTQPLSNRLKVAQVCQDPIKYPRPVHDFYFDFEAVAAGGLNPDNYAITATSGSRTLSYDLQKKQGNKQLYLEVTYEDTTKTDYIEKWKSQINYPVSGSNADQYANVDFTNTTFMMEYIPPNQDGANPDFSWPNDEIHDGNLSYSIDDLTQHYFRLMTEDGPTVFHIGSNTGKDPVDYSESTVTINYCVDGDYITYLHITRNELDVTVE